MNDSDLVEKTQRHSRHRDCPAPGAEPAATSGAASLQIAGRAIGAGQPPYIVAELSANHNGSLDNALSLIEAVSAAGADAIKLQTYTPDTITLNSRKAQFQLTRGPWRGRSLYELYQQAHTPWHWHRPLFEKADELGITLFSSAFDASAVDLLESLNAPAYKIASFEIVDLPLISKVAQTGKPLIISTGMATLAEIEAAVQTARDAACRELILLQCVSAYPADPGEYRLRRLPDMHKRFRVPVGLSDHTTSEVAAIAAVALGACMIEKHVALSDSTGGTDASFSINPRQLKSLRQSCIATWRAVGECSYGASGAEKSNLPYRRSLYVVRDVKAGERVSTDNVRSIRPADGLPPQYLGSILGCTFNQDVAGATPLSWTLLSKSEPAHPQTAD